LAPRLDGTTAIEEITSIKWPIGAAITIEIDRSYHAHGDTLKWAQLAIQLAQNSDTAFNRKPHPLWFDAAARYCSSRKSSAASALLTSRQSRPLPNFCVTCCPTSRELQRSSCDTNQARVRSAPIAASMFKAI